MKESGIHALLQALDVFLEHHHSFDEEKEPVHCGPECSELVRVEKAREVLEEN